MTQNSSKFTVKKSWCKVLDTLVFLCADGGSVFPNCVKKWKFQNPHGKVLLVVYDQAIDIKYWKHCENIFTHQLGKGRQYLFIYIFMA